MVIYEGSMVFSGEQFFLGKDFRVMLLERPCYAAFPTGGFGVRKLQADVISYSSATSACEKASQWERSWDDMRWASAKHNGLMGLWAPGSFCPG